MPTKKNSPQLLRHPLAAAIALALTTVPTGAAIISVTGDCHLADAITAANGNTTVGGCPAGGDQDHGGDIIELTTDVILSTVDNSTDHDGANGLPLVSSTITINGHGYTIARSDAGGNPFDGGIPFFRLLHVAPEGHLTLNEVTLQNGWVNGSLYIHGGGGLFNQGHATITRSFISGNGASGPGGGVHNEGTLTLTDSVITDNAADAGGGLGNSGSATITHSTVSSNSAAEAGGIENFPAGTLNLTHSTIADNDGWYDGAGLWNTGTLTVTNSTISGNELGLVNSTGGKTTLIHSTIAHNGRADAMYGGGVGLIASDSVTLIHSLIANNLDKDCEGEVSFEGINLIRDASCDALPVGQLTGDPRLGPLADNGGSTLTHALLAGSPALDRIPFTAETGCDPTTVTTDQRGINRPWGNQCDVGAFERIQPLNMETILEFFARAVAEGTLIGQGPGRSAENRLKAFRTQLRVLGYRARQGRSNLICGRLNAVLRHFLPDSPNTFVTGPATAELAIMLKNWGNELNCPLAVAVKTSQ